MDQLNMTWDNYIGTVGNESGMFSKITKYATDDVMHNSNEAVKVVNLQVQLL
jgi:hypothetical protein